jgi:sugar-specific transcriptional regulator TrmB
VKERILRELGLTANETKVYVVLLRQGPMKVLEIARRTGTYRANTYDTVASLIRKGLVRFTSEGKKKLYEATHPSKLLAMLREQKEKITEKEKRANELISELEALKTDAGSKQVTILQGREGVKAIFEDILRTGKTNHCIGAWGLPPVLKNYLSQWHQRRVKAKLLDKMIFREGAERGRELAKLSYTQCRFLPKMYDSPTAINVYGHKVAFVIGFAEPIGIMIENEDIAKDFKSYFDLLWNISKSSK